MKIQVDDLSGQEVHDLLNEHLQDMYSISPPESVHALDIKSLQQPEITLWTLWEGTQLAGCGAIKELSKTEAEIKSMRTKKEFRRKGVAAKILNHILVEAESRNYKTIYLETGPMDYFLPAVALYKSVGFIVCEPFADYELDPYSLFMKKEIF